MICPICKSNNSNLLVDYGQYPYFTVPVKKGHKKKILAKYSEYKLNAELKYAACNDCGHVYICNIPDQKIIDDLYSNYYSYPSPLKGGFEPIRDNYFIQIFNEQIDSLCKVKKLNNILEVGCYDGFILYELQKNGYNVNGCDPSEGSEIGKSFGIEIKKEFFDPKNYLDNEINFDIVISRHYIEHTIDPYEFITSLKSVLKCGGLLIIETPNNQHFLEKGLLEVFSLQHITLFTSESLKYLMNKLGMEVIFINKTPDNLIIVCKENSIQKQISFNSFSNINNQFTKKINKNRKRINKTVDDSISRKEIIAIWGAGGFGCAALSLYEISPDYIDYYIDSDSQKWGMEYLTNSIPIITPDEIKNKKINLIIVASMYSIGIINTINKMELNCQILLLSPEGSSEIPHNLNY